MGPPLVSVVIAARNAEATIDEAVASVLGQTFPDFELLVVDDGSVDRTGEHLAAVSDPRLRVLGNEAGPGLGAALNVGLDAARGAFVARMDADDVALPEWLSRVVAAIRSSRGVAVLGTGMIELQDGSLGAVHRMPVGRRAVRWAALFSTPFYHSTVILDRGVLDHHGLRYDPSFPESEDFDLWARLLAVADGKNVPEAMVLYRQHPGQASRRRAELQLELGRRIGLREISAVAPELTPERAELAWVAGSGRAAAPGRAAEAADALTELVGAFERVHGGGDARRAAAWTLARSPAADLSDRAALARAALHLDPGLPVRGLERLRRRRGSRAERAAASMWLRRKREQAVRVTLVVPEPTPFRTEMLDRVATRAELDLTVLYAGSTVQRRTWTIEPRHRAVFLEGHRVPGVYRALRHEYPISLGVFRALASSRPEVVVVSGWSTFASQAAVAWCRARKVPYVLLVESNERDVRPGWRRAVKGAVVPPILRGAAEVLVVGRLARESMLTRGVDPERISLFADTIDVERFGEATDRLHARRDELRAEAGLTPDDVVVLSVARLAPEKGLDTLVRAVAVAANPRLVLVLAGSGTERERLEVLADELGARLVVLPEVRWGRIAERFAIGDIFALLSRHEPWGVVVNEAAACELPLVVSDRVGAAFDLIEDGRNGAIVPADDPVAAGEAIRVLAADPERRRAAGRASRELMRDWGYEPSIENLIRVVRRVAGRH